MTIKPLDDGWYAVGPATFELRNEAVAYLLDSCGITHEEWRVLEALCNGVTFSEMAETWEKSRKTVWAQAHNLRVRTGVKTTAQLVAWAFRSGLVEV